MDYTKLRAQAMSSGEDEEAVTVNTRALIDKVLARYSGEWTTLRELLQNAADAGASTVRIKFETLPSAQVPLSNATSDSDVLKHVLLHHMLRRLLVTNDGHPFGVNDWSRLKRIAEGNPDETKIGAFGVGFYSVFADCEEPFVSSGSEAMAFYWKGNSLFTRKLQLPERSPDTNFVLDYRNNTTPVPSLLSLCQFLSTSLTFVALQNIELWLDDWKILSLKKKVAPSVEYPISRDVETKTKEGLMKVQTLERESVQMDAAFMKVVGWKPSSSTVVPKSSAFGENTYGIASEASSLRSFFSRLTANSSQSSLKIKALREEKAMQEIVLENLTALTTANVFLSVTTGTIRTSVSASFASELERATKKPPPKTTKLAILTSLYDEAAVSKAVTKGDNVTNATDIFASVLPGKRPGGRVFIGFPTHQTTGAGMHLSAPSVIPTVERESIDLNARWVRTWNMEMLRAAGIITRLAFTREMAELGSKVMRAAESAGRGTKITKDDIVKLLPEALHILQTFTFVESTPSSQVSQIIDESFWTTYKKASIEIYSSQGVLPTTEVRLATEDLSGFVEGIPVIPRVLVDNQFVVKLRDFGLITEINVSDVKKELGAKALTKDQLIQFIIWAGNKAVCGGIDASTIGDLLDNTVAMVGDNETQGGIITLSAIKYYVNGAKIPPDMPFPPNTLSFELTRSSGAKELQALGWEPMEIVPWLRFLVESVGGRNELPTEYDITWSPRFSAQVLAIVSKQWESLGQSSRDTVIGLLRPVTVIPTKYGMKIPSETYFPNVRLFDDLPTISPIQGMKDKVLLALGVRKTVELDTIFQRLLDPSALTSDGEKRAPKWSHVDLITYLASVRDDIPSEDLKKLRSTPICTAEAGEVGSESSKGTSKRYKISELFEPKDVLRSLRLPIIQWTGKPFRPSSPEGRFLSFLGLRATPSVHELLAFMASDDLSMRGKAMTYFIANHEINGYSKFSLSSIDALFLPVQGDEKRLVKPSACFVNETAALLGFDVLHRPLVAHANKFGVAEHPPMTECMNRLISKPPQSRREAIALFSYFATRIGEIGQNHAVKLGDAQIVPVSVKAQHQRSIPEKPFVITRHITPRMCFIGTSETYQGIFEFVDFSLEANSFLLHCGSKHEPSKAQVASMLATEPARVLGTVQSPDKYLSLLRTIAGSLSELKRDKVLFKQLMISPFLLATREIPGKLTKESGKILDGSNELDEDDEDAGIKQWTLQPASKIVIVDDYNSYRLFKEALLCAPMEEPLENLYLALGSSLISSLVQEDTRLGSVIGEQKTTMKLQKLIVERTKLFLHEYPPDNVKHNSKWLEKNLTVEMVSNITSRRSLRGYPVSHTAKKTASLNHDQRKGWVLFITARYDWYHISQALVSQLLTRPNNQATTLFEFLLNSDLRDLKRRGFNVDRILRAQAAEARIAEDERQRQFEEEMRIAREQEELWKQNQIAAPVAREERQRSAQVSMPGAFGSDSPESSPQAYEKKPRGIFSTLTKHLGMNGSQAQEQLQNFLTGSKDAEQSGQENLPPSYYDESTHGLKSEPKPGRPAGETEKVTSPHALHQNLLNAIKASRPHDSSTLFSPPVTNTVKEQASYCDARSSHNITYIGDTGNGMRIFIANDITIPATEFLVQHASSLYTFSTLLYEVGDVYTLPRKALHIFYDEVGSTIAFNSQGSVFCNFRFFQQLHEQKIDSKSAEGRTEAVSWWWVVIAHELAHNLVSDHSAEHSYYTESFITQYFPKMVAKATSYAQGIPVQRQEGLGSRQEFSLLD